MDKTRKIMFKSLEGDLSKEEKAFLDDKINNSEGLKNELKDYKTLRRGLMQQDYKFDADFSRKLLSRIQNPFDLFGSFKKIAFASAAAIAILIGSVYLMDGGLNLDSLFGLHSYSVEEEFYSMLNF
jgi:hypothetical protein